MSSALSILTEAAEHGITERELTDIVAEHAFAESTLVVPKKLTSGEWPLLAESGRDERGQKLWKSVLGHAPERPLTSLEKQWLAAVLQDPRVKLFLSGKLYELQERLKDVPPLFSEDMFVYYDRYGDGDPYTERAYIGTFHRVLRAIRERRLLSAEYSGRFGRVSIILCFPYKLEYSSKDVEPPTAIEAGDSCFYAIVCRQRRVFNLQ